MKKRVATIHIEVDVPEESAPVRFSKAKLIDPMKLLIPIEELEISVRAYGLLKKSGATRLLDIVTIDPNSCKFGPKTISELRSIAMNYGLTLDMTVEP